ncbi:unnamed protein product, partial [Musa textilis]
GEHKKNRRLPNSHLLAKKASERKRSKSTNNSSAYPPTLAGWNHLSLRRWVGKKAKAVRSVLSFRALPCRQQRKNSVRSKLSKSKLQ